MKLKLFPIIIDERRRAARKAINWERMYDPDMTPKEQLAIAKGEREGFIKDMEFLNGKVAKIQCLIESGQDESVKQLLEIQIQEFYNQLFDTQVALEGANARIQLLEEEITKKK